VGAILMDLQWIVELMNFGCLLGFVFVNISVIIHFYIRKKERRVFIYLILPALAAALCFYLWISLSNFTLIGGGIWMAGGFIYAAITTKGFKVKPRIYEE
jgi:amino acid transporter